MTREEAVISYVQAVRARYPAPRSARSAALWIAMRPAAGDDLYCVGGAFCQWRGVLSRFPETHDLARQLADTNPALSWAMAGFWAEDILDANDRGDFAGAWDLLAEALMFGNAA